MKGYRTIAFFVLSGLAYIFAWPMLTQYVSPQYVAIGSSIVGVLLRLVTYGPVGGARA